MMCGVFPLLDGYRAIAALAVLTTHVAFNTGEILNPVVGTFLGRLDLAVTVFFLLSGFLLYRPWAASAMVDRPGPMIGNYALRRAGRIFPAYWLMVIVTLAILPEIQPVRPEAWLVHLGMLHIYLPGFTLEGLTQTWSLATEVAFYSLLPLLAFVTGRRHRGDADRSSRYQLAVLAGLVFLAWAFNAIRLTGVLGDISLSGFWLPGFIDWFAIGMSMAVVSARLSLPSPPWWMKRLRSFAQDTGTTLVIAAALFVILATPIAGPVTFTLSGPGELLVKHIGFAAIAFFFLLPGFLGDPQGRSLWARLLRHPVMVYLGTISYGIFLWHLVLMRLIFEVFDIRIFSGGFIPILIATLAVSIAAGTLSWYVIERPIKRWTHRRTSVPLPQPSPAP
jgi:peptidoglycan/LPS O-acetylase OafA/YrhL